MRMPKLLLKHRLKNTSLVLWAWTRWRLWELHPLFFPSRDQSSRMTCEMGHRNETTGKKKERTFTPNPMGAIWRLFSLCLWRKRRRRKEEQTVFTSQMSRNILLLPSPRQEMGKAEVSILRPSPPPSLRLSTADQLGWVKEWKINFCLSPSCPNRHGTIIFFRCSAATTDADADCNRFAFFPPAATAASLHASSPFSCRRSSFPLAFSDALSARPAQQAVSVRPPLPLPSFGTNRRRRRRRRDYQHSMAAKLLWIPVFATAAAAAASSSSSSPVLSPTSFTPASTSPRLVINNGANSNNGGNSNHLPTADSPTRWWRQGRLVQGPEEKAEEEAEAGSSSRGWHDDGHLGAAGGGGGGAERADP